ncbi:LGFP repeat-containing protein [Mycobacterium parmense]|uniref:Uncharacterized protein n=1 Tax=Mycobacterium parmense TaxID=185642 RepID=A0A7I7YVX5_9MYCO|nr:LGFP repeat-containing protein [Mycobacterium parmense]MCV7351647.1 LGFP repeat-containing protein [Mycobacterium parmense]ORW52397.1 hypothetical protein AWC20_21700 [Mycobacterium parmense]BBZ44891.1 hypothetical protein MPRM_21720 [Mycobacterium parmense]
MRRLIGIALVGLSATALATALLAPAASASPIGDAEAAMMAAWDKAGGDTSPLGARKGDVYPAGDGFALDFDGGKMFFTPATGAHWMYGPVLDKYESLGGPAGSDLGFPTITEVPGLSGPDSRVSTFAASDKPVIFWTPEHGAFVVRGAINAAWDKLGSSGGVLGVPTGDETYDGEVTAQKFSGGQVSWNRQTKDFTTDPPALADQLKGLQVPIDPTAAINTAWRAAGGVNGPLGAKQGGQYAVGADGLAQNFSGGKVYFSPATGASAVESDILAKYESLGGPVGSDLGFPVANEADGGIPSSRICEFSAADKPVIFWSADHGAFVVRGAMRVAWDKLRGASGKLGAPVGDQAVDGDVVSQQFTGGKVSWNRAKNTYSTEPANLAPLLSGLQVAGQSQPSSSAMPPHGKKFAWQWWWLLVAVPLVALVAVSAYLAFGRRRHRLAAEGPAYAPDDVGYEPAVDQPWDHRDAQASAEHFAAAPEQQSDAGPGARVGWRRGAEMYGGETASDEEDYGSYYDVEGENPDAVDTDSIPIVSDDDLSQAGYPEPESAEQGDYADEGYQDAEIAEIPSAPTTPTTPEAQRRPEDFEDHRESYDDTASADETGAAAVGAVAAGMAARTGRHAAADEEFAEEDSEHPAEPGRASAGAEAPAGRPTIHLPLDDPYQVPDGYPIKASARFGLYYTPGSELYHDTLPELWLASEEVARANGFVKAD